MSATQEWRHICSYPQRVLKSCFDDTPLYPHLGGGKKRKVLETHSHTCGIYKSRARALWNMWEEKDQHPFLTLIFIYLHMKAHSPAHVYIHPHEHKCTTFIQIESRMSICISINFTYILHFIITVVWMRVTFLPHWLICLNA